MTMSQTDIPASTHGQLETGEPERQDMPNVNQTERWISAGAGVMLALLGLRRRSLPGLAMMGIGAALVRRGATGQCALYRALHINTAEPGAEPEDYFERGIHVAESYTIARSPRELYDYWRNVENLPRIMRHLESVTRLDDRRTHWVARAPAIYGGKVEWDAEVINDEPNYVIAWKSLPGADVDNTGSVRFLDAGERGTEVKVALEYLAPAGRLGKWIARLFGEEPGQQIREDLRNFKRMMEAGELPTTAGQPGGRCA